MEDAYASRAVPRWFLAAAIASLLFMLVGVAGYVMDLVMDPQSLGAQQQELMAARPIWMKGAYAVAVWSGLAGAVLLLMRNRLAEPVLLLSLVGTVFTFIPYALVPAVRDAVSSADIIAGVVVTAIVALIYAFARRACGQGWLR
ncbi:hypothetical protein ACUXST_002147 [Sphingomonas sp. F9_3S_D5_B_2]